MRRIGVLMSFATDEAIAPPLVSDAQGLQEHGWTVGGNVQIEYRWGANDLDRFRKYAAELVALAPDVIVATASPIVGALQQASCSVPIVFVTTIDPVGSGLVASLARAGRNLTGFTNFNNELEAKKRFEILTELVPDAATIGVVASRIVVGRGI